MLFFYKYEKQDLCDIEFDYKLPVLIFLSIAIFLL